MEKLKSFKQFLNEKMMDNIENVQDIQIDDDIMKDDLIQNDNYEDLEEEESTDILELIYDKELNEWSEQGELDLPNSFEDFYDWFVSIDEENTLASMKEDDDEVIFYIPEDLYTEYLDNQKEPDEESLEDETDDMDDDMDDDEWSDDDYNEDDDDI